MTLSPPAYSSIDKRLSIASFELTRQGGRHKALRKCGMRHDEGWSARRVKRWTRKRERASKPNPTILRPRLCFLPCGDARHLACTCFLAANFRLILPSPADVSLFPRINKLRNPLVHLLFDVLQKLIYATNIFVTLDQETNATRHVKEVETTSSSAKGRERRSSQSRTSMSVLDSMSR